MAFWLVCLGILTYSCQNTSRDSGYWIVTNYHWTNIGSEHAEQSADSPPIFVRARPCFTLWSFSLIRKTELWKTNKPPAVRVVEVASACSIHMDSNSLSHTKWNCKYHIVFAPKYRRKVAYGKIKQDIANILSMLCKRKGVKIVEAEICPDHVHMLVEIPPSISVSYFVGYLKGKSTLMIFERHANLKYKYGNRHFWCRQCLLFLIS